MQDNDYQNLVASFPKGIDYVFDLPLGTSYLIDFEFGEVYNSKSGLIKVINRTDGKLQIIAFDRFVTSNRKNPSGCDYLISKFKSSNFIVLCELKDIRLDYLKNSTEYASTQLINSLKLLRNYGLNAQYPYIYASIGIKLSNANESIKASYKSFVRHPYAIPRKIRKSLIDFGFTDVFTNFKVTDDPPYVFAI